jgi:hypothetical protein
MFRLDDGVQSPARAIELFLNFGLLRVPPEAERRLSASVAGAVTWESLPYMDYRLLLRKKTPETYDVRVISENWIRCVIRNFRLLDLSSIDSAFVRIDVRNQMAIQGC